MTGQALPVLTSASRCFPASSQLGTWPRQLYPGLAAATLADLRRGLCQRSAASACPDPGAGSAPPSRAGGEPGPASGKRSQALRRPPDRFSRAHGAQFLRAPGDRTLYTPQRPHGEPQGLQSASPPGAAGGWRRVRRARAPARGALVAILSSLAGAGGAQAAVHRSALRLQSAFRGDPGIREPRSTQLHRLCLGLQQFRGRGSLRTAGQLLSPIETSESSPASREGGGAAARRAGEAVAPLRPRPREGPASVRPPTRRAPRPTPPGAASPEVAGRPERQRPLGQAG